MTDKNVCAGCVFLTIDGWCTGDRVAGLFRKLREGIEDNNFLVDIKKVDEVLREFLLNFGCKHWQSKEKQ